MKKIMISVMLMLLIASGVQANQEHPESVAYEKLTIKSNLQLNLDICIKDIKVEQITLYKDRYDHGRLIIDFEITDTNGKVYHKSYEKLVEGGHDYYYEVVTEEMKAKGQIQK